MNRFLASILLGAALGASAPVTAQADRHEAALRSDLQRAVWPADIVRISNDYLGRYPHAPGAAQTRSELDRAAQAMRLLERKEVRLFRTDFELVAAAAATRDDARQAALGDKDAALRLARRFDSGDGGVARDMNRYVGWLQYAAALGNGPASYELALYYRREDQPALAAPYEARAEELGYKPPTALDNIRK